MSSSRQFTLIFQSSCKKVFKKQKNHTMVDWARWRHKYHTHQGAAISARARGGRLCSYAADCEWAFLAIVFSTSGLVWLNLLRHQGNSRVHAPLLAHRSCWPHFVSFQVLSCRRGHYVLVSRVSSIASARTTLAVSAVAPLSKHFLLLLIRSFCK